jgi:hypothetical protein
MWGKVVDFLFFWTRIQQKMGVDFKIIHFIILCQSKKNFFELTPINKN